MQTSEYRTARERGGLDKLEDEGARERRLKLRCHQLRDQRRMATKQLKLKAQGHWSRAEETRHKQLLEYYESGKLDEDLRQATMEHGFGRVHAPDGSYSDLRLQTFMDFKAAQSSETSSAVPAAG